jgi:hypothetical protein
VVRLRETTAIERRPTMARTVGEQGSTEGRVVTESAELSEDLTEALSAANDAYEGRIGADAQDGIVVHIGEAEREARARVAEKFVRLLGAEEDVEIINRETEQRLRNLRDERLHGFKKSELRDSYSVLPPPPPPPGEGELWWAETRFSLPSSLRGLYGFWDDAAGGVRLFGLLEYDDPDLWQGSVRVVHRFGLDRDRMPTRGRYLSSPVSDLTGVITGYIGKHWWLADLGLGSDHWSTADLGLTQTVWGSQTVPGSVPPVIGVTQLGSWSISRSMINLRSANSAGAWEHPALPGRIGFPTVEFSVDGKSTIVIELEMSLDLSLEGSAKFWFGDPNGLAAAFNRAYQWTLVRAP